MSAAETIDLIKTRPPEERAAVTAFVQSGVLSGRAREVSDEELTRAADPVLSENREFLRRLAQ